MSVILSLPIVVQACFLVCVHEETSDGYASSLGDLNVARSLVRRPVDVVDHYALACCKCLSTRLLAVFLGVFPSFAACVVLESPVVVIIDALVARHEFHYEGRLSAARAPHHQHHLLGTVLDQLILLDRFAVFSCGGGCRRNLSAAEYTRLFGRRCCRLLLTEKALRRMKGQANRLGED